MGLRLIVNHCKDKELGIGNWDLGIKAKHIINF